MLRKIMSIFLCLSLIISISGYAVVAIEYETKYLSIKRVNDDFEKTYEVLTDGENVYLKLSDLVELANFYSKVTDVSDGVIDEVVITKKKDHHGFNQDITIYPKNNTITSDLYGEAEFKGCIRYNDTIYLDICETFNYLRIKANIIDNQLFINIPVYTFLDFLIEDYQSVLINSVSQLDLLEAGEGKFSSGFFDALSLACNNFDFKLLIPGWGASELKDKQYKKAIMTLREENSTFYDKDTSEYMKEQLEKRGFEGVLASGKDLTNIMSFGGDSIQTVEDIFEALESASEINSKTYNSYMEVINWNGELFHGASELKALSKHAEIISDSLSIADIAISAYETYSRANSWNDECIKDLENLSNLNEDNYADHKGYIKRIKKMAKECYDESENNSDAVVNQVAEESLSLLIEKAITETSIYGKVADLFVLTVNTGVSIAKCFGNVAEEMDKNELSYMVTCLINIAVASRIDAEIKYDKLDLKQLNASKNLDDFRTSIKTYLKSNLRCWSYIYYLNSDGTWENSYQGKDVKSKINMMNTYLTLIDESAQYDYALDEYAINTLAPSSINEILTIDDKLDESIENDNDLSNTSTLWKKKYIDYINVMENEYQNNEDPLKQPYNYTIIYVDDDNIPEMFVYKNYMINSEFLYFNGKDISSLHPDANGDIGYIERQGTFCNTGGSMDVYFDDVYMLKNGQITKIHSGQYGAENNSSVQIDENGNFIYIYTWDGLNVSKEEYEQELNNVFDKTQAKSVYWEQDFKTADEIIEQINNL